MEPGTPQTMLLIQCYIIHPRALYLTNPSELLCFLVVTPCRVAVIMLDQYVAFATATL